jgi:AcrR family transcriptional regulator
MARTRAAVLEGAALSIARYGSRRTTMADIAASGGIAKATLYNHFRRKADVYVALVEAEVRRIAAEAADLAPSDLATALTHAAEQVGCHPAVRRLAVDEPEVLAVMLALTGAEQPSLPRSSVAAVLAAAGYEARPDRVDLVLRWVAGHLAVPGTPASRAAGGVLLAGVVSR